MLPELLLVLSTPQPVVATGGPTDLGEVRPPRLMGCGGSQPVDDEPVADKPVGDDALRIANSSAGASSSSRFESVIDANGDRAIVCIYDHPWNDLSHFDTARESAKAADAAAGAGALRGILRNQSYPCPTSALKLQQRVVSLRFSVMPADAASRIVCVRMAAVT